VVLRNKEGMFGIYPGILKPFDAFHIILLAHSQYQVVVLDLPAVAELNLILSGEELINTDTLGVGVVHTDGHLGEGSVLALGGSTSPIRIPSLLVDVSHDVLLIDVAVEADHRIQLAVGHVVNVPTEDTAKVGSNDHQVILVKVLTRGLALSTACKVVDGAGRKRRPLCRTNPKHDIIKMVVVKHHFKNQLKT
jgi:hypothetical protein